MLILATISHSTIWLVKSYLVVAMGLVGSTISGSIVNPNLEHLPEDIVNELFKHLGSIRDVVSACQVCRLWRNSGYRSSVWMKLFFNTYNPTLDEFNEDLMSVTAVNRVDWRGRFVAAYRGRSRLFASKSPRIDWKTGPAAQNLLTKTRFFCKGDFIFCLGYSIGQHERLEILRWKRNDAAALQCRHWEGETFIFGCSPTYFFSKNREFVYIVDDKNIETFDLLLWTTRSKVEFEQDFAWSALTQDGLAQICSRGSSVPSAPLAIVDGNEALRAHDPLCRNEAQQQQQQQDVIIVDGDRYLTRAVAIKEKVTLKSVQDGAEIASIELQDPCLPTLAKFISPMICIIAGEFRMWLLNFQLGKVQELVEFTRPITRSPRWNFTIKNGVFFGLADIKQADSSLERHLFIVDLTSTNMTRRTKVVLREMWDAVMVDDFMNVFLIQDHILAKLVF